MSHNNLERCEYNLNLSLVAKDVSEDYIKQRQYFERFIMVLTIDHRLPYSTNVYLENITVGSKHVKLSALLTAFYYVIYKRLILSGKRDIAGSSRQFASVTKTIVNR